MKQQQSVFENWEFELKGISSRLGIIVAYERIMQLRRIFGQIASSDAFEIRPKTDLHQDQVRMEELRQTIDERDLQLLPKFPS